MSLLRGGAAFYLLDVHRTQLGSSLSASQMVLPSQQSEVCDCSGRKGENAAYSGPPSKFSRPSCVSHSDIVEQLWRGDEGVRVEG